MMKNVVYFLLFAFALPSFAQTHIPDKNFANAIRQQCPSCIDGNDKLTAEAKDLKTLFVGVKQIKSLQGIEGFTNLQKLNCSTNQLTSLSSLPQSLLELNCGSNLLTSLPSLPLMLLTLDCPFNKLISLPVLPNGLQVLQCYQNEIEIVPVLPQTLTKLICSNNKITVLPVLPQSLLQLSCDNNLLTTLPTLPQNLEVFSCSNNKIAELSILPTTLKSLSCSLNLLTDLPTLPQGLGALNCSSNLLTNFPYLPQNLETIFCNDIPKLSCINYLLPPNLVYIYVNNTNIKCLPNKPITLANNPLPLCAVSNPNNCKLVGLREVNFPYKIYPNPSSDKLFVETPEDLNGELILTNLLGQVVEYQSNNSIGMTVFDLQHLPKGVYVLTLKTEQGSVSRKVVKE